MSLYFYLLVESELMARRYGSASAGTQVGSEGRTMSVKIAVLGLVIERPGYGYDLAQRLEERCPAWRWNTTGVYTTLKDLESKGHVRSRSRPGQAALKRCSGRSMTLPETGVSISASGCLNSLSLLRCVRSSISN